MKQYGCCCIKTRSLEWSHGLMMSSLLLDFPSSYSLFSCLVMQVMTNNQDAASYQRIRVGTKPEDGSAELQLGN